MGFKDFFKDLVEVAAPVVGTIAALTPAGQAATIASRAFGPAGIATPAGQLANVGSTAVNLARGLSPSSGSGMAGAAARSASMTVARQQAAPGAAAAAGTISAVESALVNLALSRGISAPLNGNRLVTVVFAFNALGQAAVRDVEKGQPILSGRDAQIARRYIKAVRKADAKLPRKTRSKSKGEELKDAALERAIDDTQTRIIDPRRISS